MGHKADGVEPDAHRRFGPEGLHATDTADTFQFRRNVADEIIVESESVERAVLRFQRNDHQKS